MIPLRFWVHTFLGCSRKLPVIEHTIVLVISQYLIVIPIDFFAFLHLDPREAFESALDSQGCHHR